MTLVADAFMLLAIILAVLALPTVIFIVIRNCRGSWQWILKEHQTFAGSLVTLFAAGLAVAGVLLTAANQTSNIDKQLRAQKDQIDRQNAQVERRAAYDEALHNKQVASAFLGEVTIIKDGLAGAEWRKKIDDLLAKMDAVPKTSGATLLQVVVSQPPPDFAVYFRSNTQEIGRLPLPLPQKILMFYAVYSVLEDTIAKVNSASRENFAHMDPPNVRLALTTEIKQLDALQEYGTELQSLLQKILEAPLPSLM
jgi:hypothetical protein